MGSGQKGPYLKEYSNFGHLFFNLANLEINLITLISIKNICIAYFEICLNKTYGTEEWDDDYKVPSVMINNEKCFYDSPESFKVKVRIKKLDGLNFKIFIVFYLKKANWAKTNSIGGAFVWDLSLDDFSGRFCYDGKFPLIRSALEAFY